MTLSMRQINIRQPDGQTLAEGAVSLFFLLIMLITSLGLILTTGTAVYYKVKIAFIAQTAARRAVQADTSDWLGAQRPTRFFPPPDFNKNTATSVKAIAAATNLPVPKSIVTSKTTTGNKTYLTTVVTYDQSQLFGAYTFGRTIDFTERASAVFPNTTPIGVFGHTMNVGMTSYGIYLPCYGADPATTAGPSSFPRSIAPGARFPFWQDRTHLPAAALAGFGPFQDSDTSPSPSPFYSD